MGKVQIIRNKDVEKVLMGVPNGHRHLRVYMKLKKGTALIFQEATMASISRTYVTLKLHPSARARELRMETLAERQRKEGYAAHQLVETSRDSSEVETELKEILEREALIT